MKIRLDLFLALCLAVSWGGALADSGYDFDATVVCIQPDYVFAAIGGTVASVPVLQGQRVSRGDVLAELKTTQVYAGVDGTVTGVFCEAGDSISDINKRYGALMYIEPDSKYTVTASTEEAYNLSANKYIHVGETVYLECSNGKHTGSGLVTAVKGTDFTVEISSGGFYMGETVSVYRSKSRTARSRIGKGEIARTDNVAVTGPEGGGSIAALHVGDGKAVKSGDLLLETLSGEYDARYCTGSRLTSDQDGILASLNVKVGASVNKGDVIATLYPTDRLQLEAKLNEVDLSALTVGTPVTISFNWSEDLEDAPTYTGTVTRVLYATVSSLAASNSSSGNNNSSSGNNSSSEQKSDGSASSDTVTYSAYIDFEADESIRLGMTATVRTLSGENEPEEELEEEELEEEELEEEKLDEEALEEEAPDRDEPDEAEVEAEMEQDEAAEGKASAPVTEEAAEAASERPSRGERSGESGGRGERSADFGEERGQRSADSGEERGQRSAVSGEERG